MEENKLAVVARELNEVAIEEDDEDVMLPGFRFHPTDEELVGFYLPRKVQKKGFSIEIITEIDIYKHDPWDLPKAIVSGEKEWYFFCLRGRKYRNSVRPNRVTGSGFWKATGIDRPIYSPNNSSNCIGLKKSLVYYRGSAGKGVKTEWMLHEFRLPTDDKNNENISPSMQEAEIWTICRIFKRNVPPKKYSQNWRVAQQNSSKLQQLPADSSSKISSSFESDGANEYMSFVCQDRTPHEEVNFINNYYGDSNPIYGGHCYWNSQAQTMLSSTDININTTQSPNIIELHKDGNWDELSRIWDFSSDQSYAYEYSCT